MSEHLVIPLDAAQGIDTHIFSDGYANLNSGSASPGVIGSSNLLKAGVRSRYLLRFDVSQIPPGSMIVSATLTLTKDWGFFGNGAVCTIHRVTRGDWTELGATWQHYNGIEGWAAPGGDFEAQPAGSATLLSSSTELVFDSLADLIGDAVNLRGGQLDVLVAGDETSTNQLVTVHSFETSQPEFAPKLVVEYVPPAALGVQDHADGTGATALVTSETTGGQAAVYVRGFEGDLGSGDWTAAGPTLLGVPLALPLAAGHYFAYAIVTSGTAQAASPVVYFVVTDGQESIHTRCLAAVQARIRLLALEGVATSQVVIEKVPTGRSLAGGTPLPAVVITPQRAAMPPAAGTNGADDVHYDVLVAIYDRDNQDPTLRVNLDRHLLWRQQIARAFRNQRLAGVPEVINSEVEPAEGLLDEAWQRELMASALRLRFTCRETRGF